MDSLRFWRAVRVFYHGDRDVMLRNLVWPLLTQLTTERLSDRFYFVRYSLGGPHLRLRWRLRQEADARRAESVLARLAREFIAMRPSLSSLSRDRILATNRALATTDTAAASEVDFVAEDNSWCTSPTLFEIDRYGGPDLFASSLDLFCFSSLEVLKKICQHRDGSREWINSATLRLILRLAWSLADDQEEVIRLAAYASEAWGQALAPCIDRADQAFERAEKQITELVIEELESLTAVQDYSQPCGLVTASRKLSAELKVLAPRNRWQVTSSHLHMTANRMGLSNPEEVYLSRLLWRGICQLRQRYPGTWRLLWLSRDAVNTAFTSSSMTQSLETALLCSSESPSGQRITREVAHQ